VPSATPSHRAVKPPYDNEAGVRDGRKRTRPQEESGRDEIYEKKIMNEKKSSY
jgi:hypothetical protein